MSDNQTVTFTIRGEDSLRAVPALYSNFLAIGRVGADVQFEFVFVDLNVLARTLQTAKKEEAGKSEPMTIEGKTVAKIIMPASSFIQLKGHLQEIFKAIEEVLQKEMEVQHERSRATSG